MREKYPEINFDYEQGKGFPMRYRKGCKRVVATACAAAVLFLLAPRFR
jgi:hypothetical protein